MGTGEFQTLHLCENPPNGPPKSNFYRYIDSVCIGFQISFPLKLRLFYLAFYLATGGGAKKFFSRPSRRMCLALRARLALAPARLKNVQNNACSTGYTFEGFARLRLRPLVGEEARCVTSPNDGCEGVADARHASSRASDDECACMGEG